MGWGAAGEDTTSRCDAARPSRRDEHGLRGMVAIEGESNQDERRDDAAAARKNTGEENKFLLILALGDFALSYHASCAAWATGGNGWVLGGIGWRHPALVQNANGIKEQVIESVRGVMRNTTSCARKTQNKQSTPLFFNTPSQSTHKPLEI